MAIILGIDPGSRVTGYGVIALVGNQPQYLASGCIRMTDRSMSARMKTIFQNMNDLIAHYQPTEAAIEQVFVGKNANSALKLGHARGAALLSIELANLPLQEYAARSIKQAVAASGAADKKQVQHMVMRILKLDKSPAADAADALAIALCHVFTNNRLATAL